MVEGEKVREVGRLEEKVEEMKKEMEEREGRMK